MKLTGRTIVCFSTQSWEGFWTRKKYFMQYFAEDGNTVYYVDPIRSLGGYLRDGREHRANLIRTTIEPVSERFFVVKPSSWIPLHETIPPLKWLAYELVARRIRRHARVDRFVVWVYSPDFAEAVRHFPRRTVVYDVVDDFRHYPGVDAQRVAARENKLLLASDIIATSSRNLYQRFSSMYRNVVFVPNGVHSDAFARARASDIPADLARVREGFERVVGYVGAIAPWIDFDMLEAAFAALSEVAFVFVGWSTGEQERRRLASWSNVFLLGEKSRDEVPRYVAHFDVCIIPFLVNELTVSVNPLKAYEYLAAGKPVVSSALPEIEHLRDVVTFVRSREEFVSALRREIDGSARADVEERMRAAREYDWRSLHERLAAYLAEKLDGESLGENRSSL